MRYDIDTTGRSRLSPQTVSTLDQVDRILLAACAVIWLIALGATVAATVALVDLGSSQQDSGSSGTPWLLYAVIAVSAVVIIGAVPLLLRARRNSDVTPRPSPVARPAEPRVQAGEEPTEKLRGFADQFNARFAGTLGVASGRTRGDIGAAVDQMWLRCAVALGCAMGLAMIAIGVATYLMAVGNDGVSWGLYGLAGLITVGMAAVPWFYLRELHTLLEGAAAG